MVVLNTKKRNGIPRTCSTSKVWSDTMVPSRSTDRMTGAMIGTVIRSAVRSVLAPATLDASSKAAFMFRKAGVSRMTLTVSDPVITCTHTMPQNE
jgi:hypothetical protein